MSENSDILYCANHPQVSTSLRCNRCEKPICSKCAVLTPTGYRCNECIRGQQKVFDTAQWYDYPLVFITVTILTYIGTLIVDRIGFFTILLAPVAGVIIAETARRIVSRRRSKNLTRIAIAGVIIGVLPRLFVGTLSLVIMFSQVGLSGAGALFPLIWQGAYVFMVASTVFYRLSGINIR
jgi:hypothetical protein